MPAFKYKKLALEQTKKIQELEKVVLSQKTEIQSICDKRDRISELEQKIESQYKEFGVTEKLSDILSSLGDMNKQIDKMESHFTLPKTVHYDLLGLLSQPKMRDLEGRPFARTLYFWLLMETKC